MTDSAPLNVLITGASRGIGAACAARLSADGHNVIGHSTKGGDGLIAQDLSKAGAGAALFAKAIDQAGHIDAVINNAGIYLPSPLSGEGWEEGWQKTLAVNVRAPADICRAAIAHFRARGGGRIVNIASRAAYRGDGVDHAAYAASKAALVAMGKTWARGLSGENIEIYTLAPGWVETRMAPQDIAARAAAIKDIPLGRVAQPEEIAAFAAFLLSGQCPSAVGGVFDINGASFVR